MCGRYTLFSHKTDTEARRLWQALMSAETKAPASKGDIAPSEYAPVYIAGDKNGRVPTVMKWGYPNPYRKALIINARSETPDASRYSKRSGRGLALRHQRRP